MEQETSVSKIDVFYQGSKIQRVEHLEADGDATLGAIKAQIVAKHACDADVLLFREDGDEPVDETLSAKTAAGPSGAKLHVHACRHIDITVAFAGRTAKRKFAPGTTVGRVKQWAAEHEFGLTKDDAAEHVLQIASTGDRPAPGTHIGSIAHCPDCRIAFDLVPDQRINGAHVEMSHDGT